MPPTAGVGLGIDRLTMILTGARTLREVVLFPAMRNLLNSPAAQTAGRIGSTEDSTGWARKGRRYTWRSA